MCARVATALLRLSFFVFLALNAHLRIGVRCGREQRKDKT